MKPEGPDCASDLFGTVPPHPVQKMVKSQINKALKPLAIQSCQGLNKYPVIPHQDSYILHDRTFIALLWHF